MKPLWKIYPDGLYYDYKHDHLVELFWVSGVRWIVEAHFDDVYYKGTSKPGGDPSKANLILIDKRR